MGYKSVLRKEEEKFNINTYRKNVGGRDICMMLDWYDTHQGEIKKNRCPN